MIVLTVGKQRPPPGSKPGFLSQSECLTWKHCCVGSPPAKEKRRGSNRHETACLLLIPNNKCDTNSNKDWYKMQWGKIRWNWSKINKNGRFTSVYITKDAKNLSSSLVFSEKIITHVNRGWPCAVCWVKCSYWSYLIFQCFPPGADMIDALDFYFQVR